VFGAAPGPVAAVAGEAWVEIPDTGQLYLVTAR